MRVAIVHHWFVTRRGGERVDECIASLFPEAEIFTLVAGPAGMPESLTTRRLHTSDPHRARTVDNLGPTTCLLLAW